MLIVTLRIFLNEVLIQRRFIVNLLMTIICSGFKEGGIVNLFYYVQSVANILLRLHISEMRWVISQID
jgi:hypothetical protein